MPVSVDEVLLEELENDNIATLTNSYHDMDYLGIDDLIEDVRENGVYKNDIFGIHENETDEDDELFEMDSETALRKAIDSQFEQDCYQ